MHPGNRDYLQNHSPRVSTSRNGAPWLQLEVTWRFWIGFRCTIRSWTGGVAIISINKHYQTKCQLQHQDMSLVVRVKSENKIIPVRNDKFTVATHMSGKTGNDYTVLHWDIFRALHPGLISHGHQPRFFLVYKHRYFVEC